MSKRQVLLPVVMTISVVPSKDVSYDSLFSPLTSVDLQTYRWSLLPLPISTCSFYYCLLSFVVFFNICMTSCSDMNLSEILIMGSDFRSLNLEFD